MDNPYAFNQPKDIRNIQLGTYELRKLWDPATAEFYYVLAQRYRVERCEMVGEDDKKEPNWDNIIETVEDWGVVPSHRGDLDWAKRNAEHYGIEVPEEEYKQEEE